MAGPSGLNIAGNRLDEYKCDANDAVCFRLVREKEDIEDESKIFKPEMTHQIFGPSESIFGYKDLKIDIMCTAARMHTYINVKYSDKVSPEKHDGLSPDDIWSLLREHEISREDNCTNMEDFQVKLKKDSTFRPFGKLHHVFNVTKAETTREFEIYSNDIETPGFRDFHTRIQPFLLFYVDAASYIDVDDERWTYYTVVEKYKKDGEYAYAFVGYMTVYQYYAYPGKTRPRVSQVLVMPPYQRMGIGATLLQTFYNECYTKSDLMDITVEDPSENFQRVRDFVDAKNCKNLESFQPNNLLSGFSETMVTEARDKLLLNRKQARRMYEILRLMYTNRGNPEEYKQYRLDVKNRLNIPFQKNGRDFEKLKRALNDNEFAATMNNMSKEQRLEYLIKQYQEVEDEYKQVIERLQVS